MDVRQLTQFVGVADNGSFSAAARKIHISQPALTRTVNLLEASLGTKLFERNLHGVDLTEDGKTLYRHATLIISSLQIAKNELAVKKDKGFGEVNIGIASLFTNFLISEALTRVSRAHDRFSATLKVSDFGDLIGLLRTGALDLVIEKRRESPILQDLSFEPLCNISYAVVVGADNPLSQKDIVTLKELIDEKWVAQRQLIQDSLLTPFFSQAGVPAPRCKICTPSLDVIINLIRLQHFIGILPLPWIAHEISNERIVPLNVPELEITSTPSIVTRKKGALSKAAKYFVEEMRNVALQPRIGVSRLSQSG